MRDGEVRTPLLPTGVNEPFLSIRLFTGFSEAPKIISYLLFTNLTVGFIDTGSDKLSNTMKTMNSFLTTAISLPNGTLPKPAYSFDAKSNRYAGGKARNMTEIEAMSLCLRDLNKSIAASTAGRSPTSPAKTWETACREAFETGINLLASAVGLTPAETELKYVKGGIQ